MHNLGFGERVSSQGKRVRDVVPDDAVANNADRPFDVRTSRFESRTIYSTDLGQRYGIRRNGLESNWVVYDPVNVYEYRRDELVREGYDFAQACDLAIEYTEEYVTSRISENMTKVAPNLQTGLMRAQRKHRKDMQTINDIGSSNHVSGASRTPQGMKLSGLGSNPNSRDVARRAPAHSGQEETFSFQSADGNIYTFNKTQGGVLRQDFVAFLSILANLEVERGGLASTVFASAKVTLKDNDGQSFFSAKEHLAAQQLPPALPDGMSFEGDE